MIDGELRSVVTTSKSFEYSDQKKKQASADLRKKLEEMGVEIIEPEDERATQVTFFGTRRPERSEKSDEAE
jgi:hypothetical protein